MLNLSKDIHQAANNNVLCTRKQREFIPDSRKDETYWDRRRKNNEAAKRSREKRRISDMLLEARVLELTRENALLHAELYAIKSEFRLPHDEHFGINPDSIPVQMPDLNCRTRRASVRSLVGAETTSETGSTSSSIISTSSSTSSLLNSISAVAAAAAVCQAAACQQQQQQQATSTTPASSTSNAPTVNKSSSSSSSSSSSTTTTSLSSAAASSIGVNINGLGLSNSTANSTASSANQSAAMLAQNNNQQSLLEFSQHNTPNSQATHHQLSALNPHHQNHHHLCNLSNQLHQNALALQQLQTPHLHHLAGLAAAHSHLQQQHQHSQQMDSSLPAHLKNDLSATPLGLTNNKNRSLSIGSHEHLYISVDDHELRDVTAQSTTTITTTKTTAPTNSNNSSSSCLPLKLRHKYRQNSANSLFC